MTLGDKMSSVITVDLFQLINNQSPLQNEYDSEMII